MARTNNAQRAQRAKMARKKGVSGVRIGNVFSDPNREDAVFELFELMILSLDYGIEKLRTKESVELLMRMLVVGGWLMEILRKRKELCCL